MEHTIENYLTCFAGHTAIKYHFEIDPSDEVFLRSVARQVARSVALTDRQHNLVKDKLAKYKEQFKNNGLNNFDLAMETLRMPLRSIDRSQTITVEDGWMVVRFPFNKKTIAQLDKVSSKYKQFYQHTRSSNEHKFKLYEPVIHEVVELFKTKQFNVDQSLLDIHEEILKINKHEFDYVPSITDQGVINLSENAVEMIKQDLGDFDENTAIKYWDRSLRYAYKKTPREFKNYSALAQEIANRHSQKVYMNPEHTSLKNVADAVKELDRFPLLVTLSRRKELEELEQYASAFDFVDTQQQIVLNRIDDNQDPNYQLNQYIKDRNFNTWLDKDIKIAYIFKNNLPKLLIKGNWRPNATVSLNGEREQTNVGNYIHEYCDLHMILDNQVSYWEDTMSRQLTQWV